MPPKAKPNPAEQEQSVTLEAAPKHANELCAECGQNELDPSTTVFACAHGTWRFTPTGDAAEPELSDDEKRAAALSILGLTEDQIAALATPTA